MRENLLVIHCHTRVLRRVKFFSGLVPFCIFINDLKERIRVHFAGVKIRLRDRIRNPKYLDKLGKYSRKHIMKLNVKIAMLLKHKEIVAYFGRNVHLNKCNMEQDVGLNKGNMGKTDVENVLRI